MNTRLFSRFIAAWMLCCACTQISQAQTTPPLSTVESTRTPVRLLRSPEIQKHLLLSQSQMDAIEEAALQVDQKLWKLRDVSGSKAMPEANRLHQQFDAKWRKILLPSQATKADQLILQARSWHALQLPWMSHRLGLSEAQAREYSRFANDLKQHPVSTAAELAIKEAQWQKAQLSETQQARIQELLGSPFDFTKARIPETSAPELRGVDEWINTSPLTLKSLHGKVVVVHFWTFACINCIHNMPHYKKWFNDYTNEPVVLLGIHTPETKEEFDIANVKKAMKERKLDYPVAVDNKRENWNAWGNDIWPSVYLIDKRGYVRYWWYGELNWKDAHQEKVVEERIRELLDEKDDVKG